LRPRTACSFVRLSQKSARGFSQPRSAGARPSSAGFALSGVPVGTFLRSGLLFAGQKVFGGRYEASRFYQNVERDLAFGIMRSHFHHGYPKGAHRCVQCRILSSPLAPSLLRLCGTCGGAEGPDRGPEVEICKAAQRPMMSWSLSCPRPAESSAIRC
jgi:hypothetical protein